MSAFLAGLIFGLGLVISGFFDPNHVLAFFDIFGAWEPWLIITLSLSMAMAMIAFKFISYRSKSLLNQSVQLPIRKDVNQTLILGSCLFGAGWGLIGFCPSSALILLASKKVMAWYFFIGFLPGTFLMKLVKK